MAQHFLLSAAARSLSPAKVARMSDRGAENVFLRLRWPETDGKPVCPNCGCQVCYDCRRSASQARWRCKACRVDFSVTSGTLFAWHKLPLRTYLMAIAVFCNEVTGKSMVSVRPGACSDRRGHRRKFARLEPPSVAPYVDGPLLARLFCGALIRSLASICPACCCART
jgi:hypothetical protein